MSFLSGAVLDHYLSRGYYRIEQDLFTCQRLTLLSGASYPVHWLRVNLGRLAWGPRQRRLLRLNAELTVAVKPLTLSAEHERLYARYYAEVVDFDTCATLRELLLGPHEETVFDSHVVEVRDAGRLVAGGVFDRGLTTLMGLVNYYDPAYRRQSLGKFLLLQKALWGRGQGLAYYYPGYLASGYPKFNYKLFVGEAATEVYDALADEWRPFSWAEVGLQAAYL